MKELEKEPKGGADRGAPTSSSRPPPTRSAAFACSSSRIEASTRRRCSRSPTRCGRRLGDAAVVLGIRGRRPRAPGGERRAVRGGAWAQGGRRRARGGRRWPAAAAAAATRWRRPAARDPEKLARGARRGAGRDREGARLMRILALDHGAARCGAAVSDPTGTLATPLAAVERPGHEAGPRRARAAGGGAGRGARGGGPAADAAPARRASRRSARARSPSGWSGESSVPVELHDERLTTRLAERTGGRATPTRAPPRTCSRATSLAPGRAPPSELRPAARPGRSNSRGARGRAPASARRGAPGSNLPPRPRWSRSRRTTVAPGTGWPRPRNLTQRREPPVDAGHAARAAGWAASSPLAVLLVIVVGIAWFANALFQPFKGDGGRSRARDHPAGLEPRARSPTGSSGAGVVDDAGFFQLRARLGGHSGDLSRGSYELRKDMSYSAAIDELQQGVPPNMVQVAIPEGLLAAGDRAAHEGPARQLPRARAAALPRSTRAVTGRRGARPRGLPVPGHLRAEEGPAREARS